MTDLEISRLVEETEAEAIYQMHSMCSVDAMDKMKASVVRIGAGTAIRTDISEGFSLNRVAGTGFGSETAEEIFEQTGKFFEGRKNIYSIQPSPFILDDNFKQQLEKNGFEFRKNWVRFYRDTAGIPEIESQLVIRKIGRKEKDIFAEMVIDVFGFQGVDPEFAVSTVEQENWNHYLAYNGDKPVATACLFINGQTAWMSLAATLPEFRGRGAQSALMARRIRDANEAGCSIITSETAEDNSSYRNMQRFGFKLLYKRPNYVKQP